MNVVFDWGGTIVKDGDVFADICRSSDNFSSSYNGPDSWDSIRSIGNINYFDSIPNYFYKCLGSLYPDSIRVISRFCGLSQNDKTKSFILFDNKPSILKEPKDIIRDISFAFNETNGSVNPVIGRIPSVIPMLTNA